MFKDSLAFSGFSTNDIKAAEEFYVGLLGVTADTASNSMGMLSLSLATGGKVIVYPKPDHQAASFTVLNFPVPDIDAAVSDLRAKGIEFEQYDGLTDATGVARGLEVGRGPNIAWFKDPAGNILSILQTE